MQRALAPGPSTWPNAKTTEGPDRAKNEPAKTAASGVSNTVQPSVCPADSELAEWLCDELVLQRVLSHLVADDIHECRRVSQRWKRVCNKLPVPLKVEKREHLLAAAEMFPNAASLSQALPRNASWWENDESDSLLTQRLCAMSSLRELALGWLPERGTLAILETLFASLSRLEVLSIHHCASNNAQVALLSALSGLKCLKQLKLPLLQQEPGTQIEPLTELQKLQKLEVDARQLVTTDGRLIFPSTALTELRLHSCSLRSPMIGRNTHEGLRFYGPRLRSLKLGWNFLHRMEVLELDYLSSIEKLEHLAISGTLGNDFHTVLEKLSDLRSLEIDILLSIPMDLPALVFSLTALTSLVMIDYKGCLCKSPGSAGRCRPERESRRATIGATLSALSNLVKLRVTLDPGTSPVVIDRLDALSKLESLTIESFSQTGFYLGQSVSGLGKLRKLSVINIVPGEATLQAAAELPALTGLVFSYSLDASRSCAFLLEASRLTKILDLALVGAGMSYGMAVAVGLYKATPEPPVDFYECLCRANLPQLRYLTAWNCGDPPPQMADKLCRLFPRLGKIRRRAEIDI